MSWVRIPPEAAHFSLEKCLPCCFVLYKTLLASFFLPFASLINMYLPTFLLALPYLPSSSPTFVRLFIRCMSMCYLVCAACSVSQVVRRKTTVVSGERVCYTHFLVQSALYMCVYTHHAYLFMYIHCILCTPYTGPSENGGVIDITLEKNEKGQLFS